MSISKSQIDRIGDQIKSGGLDAETLVQLSHYRNQFDAAYKIVEDILSNKLNRNVSGRPAKSTTAIIEKLQRESIRLSQMQDIAGCRVIVPGLYSQDRLIDDLRIMLERPRIIDRRNAPSHGYRAVHVITMTRGLPVEVQVRTRAQHTWADISEKLADSYGQEIKYGEGREEVVQFLADMSAEVEILEKIRFDKVMVKGGDAMRFHRSLGQRSAVKTVRELERLERQCMIRLQQILKRDI